MRTVISILSIVFPSVLHAQSSALYPPKNEIADTSLTVFIDSLKRAIKSQDKDFILQHLHENIKNSFGGDGGIEEFKEYWDWDSSDSKFWPLVNKL